MTQNADRLDRMEQMLEVTIKQQQDNAVVVAQQNAVIARILEIQQANALSSASNNAAIAQLIEQHQLAIARMNRINEQQRVTTEQQQANAIAQRGAQLESSIMHLRQRIDDSVERMGEILRQAGCPPHKRF